MSEVAKKSGGLMALYVCVMAALGAMCVRSAVESARAKEALRSVISGEDSAVAELKGANARLAELAQQCEAMSRSVAAADAARAEKELVNEALRGEVVALSAERSRMASDTINDRNRRQEAENALAQKEKSHAEELAAANRRLTDASARLTESRSSLESLRKESEEKLAALDARLEETRKAGKETADRLSKELADAKEAMAAADLRHKESLDAANSEIASYKGRLDAATAETERLREELRARANIAAVAVGDATNSVDALSGDAAK